MKRAALLSTVLIIIPNLTQAQCVATTNCSTLGYTETSCPNGGLKCPFGNTWSCKINTSAPTEPETPTAATLGTCTGYAQNCSIGQILNSDGTCTTGKTSGKTPIGVVVYISADKKCGQALALDDLGEQHGVCADVPVLPTYLSIEAAELDFNSCGNTRTIIENTDNTSCVPAWNAYNYAPSGMASSKGKWCLPAAGVAVSMINNYTAINEGLAKAGGEALPSSSLHNRMNLSSSKSEINSYWRWCFACKWLGYYHGVGAYNVYVRPVIEF